jgi:hypothetical protein
MIHDLPPDISKHLAGPAGSLIALLWLHGRWPKKVAMFAAGWVLSFYGSPIAAQWLGFSEGFAGFLLGLFGMAIVDKIFETWKTLEIGTLLSDWIRKVLNLEHQEK